MVLTLNNLLERFLSSTASRTWNKIPTVMQFEYFMKASKKTNKQTKLLCKIVYLWIIFYIFKVSKEWSAILDKIGVESKVYFHCCIHHLSNVLCRPINFFLFFHLFQCHIRHLCTGIYELEDCSLDKRRWENIKLVHNCSHLNILEIKTFGLGSWTPSNQDSGQSTMESFFECWIHYVR